jgi:pimeloyl-ACP methyl ester carboxylesterase
MGRLTGYTRGDWRFAVRDEGPLDGDPVVLLHGFPVDSAGWHALNPLLHRAGVRTVAPDQRGYSPGARPAATAEYRLTELVADAVALIDAIGARQVHLVGHDWGGMVAWALAGRHPDRLASLTVLSTPHPEAFRRAIRSGSQALRSWYIAAFQLPVLPERYLSHRLGRLLTRTGLPSADVDQTVRRMSEPGALTAALAWYRALPSSAAEPATTCRVPTTFVWGRHDSALGRQAAEHTRDAVSAPYRFVELDAGHWLPQTRPIEISAVLLDRIRAVAPSS